HQRVVDLARRPATRVDRSAAGRTAARLLARTDHRAVAEVRVGARLEVEAEFAVVAFEALAAAHHLGARVHVLIREPELEATGEADLPVEVVVLTARREQVLLADRPAEPLEAVVAAGIRLDVVDRRPAPDAVLRQHVQLVVGRDRDARELDAGEADDAAVVVRIVAAEDTLSERQAFRVARTAGEVDGRPAEQLDAAPVRELAAGPAEDLRMIAREDDRRVLQAGRIDLRAARDDEDRRITARRRALAGDDGARFDREHGGGVDEG